MPRIDWVRECALSTSVRAKQLQGMFDVPAEVKTRREWSVDLPLDERAWNVGLIVGPSGAGKTSLLETLSGAAQTPLQWEGASILDDFPQGMGIRDVIALLCSVGFSSPPAWLKPFGALSNGEQFRVTLARRLAEAGEDTCYIDEFTSVVDRTVAKTASVALAKKARTDGLRCVLATCHYDVTDWLAPDWVCEPHTGSFAWRDCLQRPSVDVTVQRVHHSAWRVFAPYHYLSADLNKAARCFCMFWEGVPVAFTSVLPWVGKQRGSRLLWREHRTVCLPDYQGMGFGTRLSDGMGSILRALNGRWTSVTSHPAMIGYRQRSANWVTTRLSGFSNAFDGGIYHGTKVEARFKRASAAGRLTQAFEYIGPAHPDAEEARRVWDGA